MNKRTILLITLILTIGTTIMMAAAHPDDEVTVTDLKREINSDEELVVKKPRSEDLSSKRSAQKQPEVTVNTQKKNLQRKAEEASKEFVNRRPQQQRQQPADRFGTRDSWFNRPRSRTNRMFRNSLFDNNQEDIFGGAFRDLFEGLSGPLSRRNRGAFGRNTRPLSSLLSGVFDDFEPSFGSNGLIGGWPGLRRAPGIDLFGSFDKLLQDFNRPQRDQWKEAPGALELRVNLPEGMNKDNIEVAVEKGNNQGGHTLLIHGKTEKQKEVTRNPTDTPQLQDSNKQGQAETKQAGVVAPQEPTDVAPTLNKYGVELQRRYTIPSSIDANKVSAEIHGNTLVITLSKKAKPVKRINIQ